MDGSTQANTKMTESTDMELMFGLTVDNMKACGKTESNMARVFIVTLTDKPAKDSGQRASVLLGLRLEKTFQSESALLI